MTYTIKMLYIDILKRRRKYGNIHSEGPNTYVGTVISNCWETDEPIIIKLPIKSRRKE